VSLRLIVFEWRVLIAYRVLPRSVDVLAVAYGGRQLTPDLLER